MTNDIKKQIKWEVIKHANHAKYANFAKIQKIEKTSKIEVARIAIQKNEFRNLILA